MSTEENENCFDTNNQTNDSNTIDTLSEEKKYYLDADRTIWTNQYCEQFWYKDKEKEFVIPNIPNETKEWRLFRILFVSRGKKVKRSDLLKEEYLGTTDDNLKTIVRRMKKNNLFEYVFKMNDSIKEEDNIDNYISDKEEDKGNKLVIVNIRKSSSDSGGYKLILPGDEATWHDNSQKKGFISEFLGTAVPLSEIETESGLMLKMSYDIFYRPDYYIEPENWLQNMEQNAFTEGRHVHVISGERGIGKSFLAKRFLSDCVNNNNNRIDLRFNNIVFVTYRNNLKTTISRLKLQEQNNEIVTDETNDYVYYKKIKLLTELHNEKEPVLLLIDNYDSSDYKSELSEESRVYEEIRGTGCHILITSRNSLDSKTCYGSNQTVLMPLEISELVVMFKKHAGIDGDDTDKDDEIERLIKEDLISNTYLVVLAAHLVSTSSLDEVSKLFKNHNIADSDEPIEGRGTNDKTIFEHLSELFDFSNVFDSEEKRRIFYNLSLIDISGISCQNFFEMTMNDMEYVSFKNHLNELVDCFWVFKDGKNKNANITIRPLVRDLILICKKGDLKYEYVKKYVEYLNNHSYFRTYDEKLSEAIDVGTAAIEALDILLSDEDKKNETDFACLVAKTASNFDIIRDIPTAYEYAIKAVSLLNQIDIEKLSDNQLYQMGLAYNIAGYAILHNEKAEGYTKKALDTLGKVSGLLEKRSDKTQKNLDVEILKTTNMGNIAAIHAKINDYETMKKMHMENREYREELLEDCNDDEKKLLYIKLADSCKGVGTAYYYLANEKYTAGENDVAKEYLENSIKHHQEAVDYYRNAYGDIYHFQIAVAQNRKVGAIIQLYNYFPELRQDEEITKAIGEMKEAKIYLENMKRQNNSELKNCEDNLNKLKSLLKDESKIDKQK